MQTCKWWATMASKKKNFLWNSEINPNLTLRKWISYDGWHVWNLVIPFPLIIFQFPGKIMHSSLSKDHCKKRGVDEKTWRSARVARTWMVKIEDWRYIRCVWWHNSTSQMRSSIAVVYMVSEWRGCFCPCWLII